MAVVVLPSTYRDGTATVAANGVTVTGTGTLWTNSIIAGDFFGTHKGFPIRILSVDSDSQLTLAYAWPGAAQTNAAYEIMLQSDVGRMQETSRELLQKMQSGNLDALAGLNGLPDTIPYFLGPGAMGLYTKQQLTNGARFDVQVPDIAGRAAYDAQAAGYAVLVSNVGDGRAAIYTKKSPTSGDWSTAAYITGPVGATGPVGMNWRNGWNAANTYAINDGVYWLGSSWIAITAGLGSTNGAPSIANSGNWRQMTLGFNILGTYNPATTYYRTDSVLYNGSTWQVLPSVASTVGNAPPNLPTTSNAWWQLIAQKGADGTGVGDMLKATYDPTNIALDAFNQNNHYGNDPFTVGTVAALQALDTTKHTCAFLAVISGSRNGLFIWSPGDYSARVAADTAQGIFIKANAIAATSGAWVRAEVAFFSNSWKVGWFGVNPNNTPVNNTTNLNAALALAVMQDSAIEFPAGIHQFSAKITISTAFNLVLFSNAIKECELQWTASNGGIDLTFTDPLQPPTIRGLNFTTTIAGGGTALKVTGTALASATLAGPLIEDVDCRGKTVASTYWTQGIYLKLCWYPRVIRPDIKGMDDTTSPFDMTEGIYCEDCQAPFIRDVTIFHCEHAIYATGSLHGEGLSVIGGEIVGVSEGIRWNLGAVKPSIVISDLHINAYVNCVNLNNVYQITIHDCLFYKTHLSTSNWYGVQLTNCAQVNIHDMNFSTAGLIDTTPGVSTPVALVNSHDCRITNCLAFGWLTPNSSFVLLANSTTADNVMDGLTIANDGSRSNFVGFAGIVSSPGPNTFRNCVPDVNAQMASGDTTPDVGNLSSPVLEYTGGAVSVTTFDNPKTGQEFTLFCNTGSSVLTLVNNATGTGLIVKGGNFLMPAGSCVHFKYHGSLWREMWRS